MKVIAINGSPRKKGNTATLLMKALRGAEAAGAKTKLIHLYKYKYQGCVSCFGCKKKGSKYIARCAMKDELTEILEKSMKADVLLIGTPVYMNNITGMIQSYIERLIFPCISYDAGEATKFKGTIHTAFIYTMNMPEEYIIQSGFDRFMDTQQQYTRVLNGNVQKLISADTLQFRNYDKYDASIFDVTHKARIHETRFPLECNAAHQLGYELASLCK